jgi:hypothetical protein
MLTLSESEVRTVKAWAEKAETSPFPQEHAVVSRLKKNVSSRSMMFSKKELEVILYWAEQETKAYSVGESFLLEHEAELIAKIESSLND